MDTSNSRMPALWARVVVLRAQCVDTMVARSHYPEPAHRCSAALIQCPLRHCPGISAPLGVLRFLWTPKYTTDVAVRSAAPSTSFGTPQPLRALIVNCPPDLPAYFEVVKVAGPTYFPSTGLSRGVVEYAFTRGAVPN